MRVALSRFGLPFRLRYMRFRFSYIRFRRFQMRFRFSGSLFVVADNSSERFYRLLLKAVRAAS